MAELTEQQLRGFLATAVQVINNGISGVEVLGDIVEPDPETYLREEWLPFATSVRNEIFEAVLREKQPKPTPAGTCPVCEGDGYVDVPDPETGGVLGPAPCPNPDCEGGRV